MKCTESKRSATRIITGYIGILSMTSITMETSKVLTSWWPCPKIRKDIRYWISKVLTLAFSCQDHKSLRSAKCEVRVVRLVWILIKYYFMPLWFHQSCPHCLGFEQGESGYPPIIAAKRHRKITEKRKGGWPLITDRWGRISESDPKIV